MLKDLKIDFPAILAINIFITFAAVIIISGFVKLPIDPALIQVLTNIVLLMVGFYFGSSVGSKDANQTVKQVALSTMPPTTEPKP